MLWIRYSLVNFEIDIVSGIRDRVRFNEFIPSSTTGPNIVPHGAMFLCFLLLCPQ
jgi:hypothetical protein